MNLKRMLLTRYFDSAAAKVEIKTRISAISSILEKEDDPKKASKKLEIEIDRIASLYVSISEIHLLVKDDPQAAKASLRSCLKFIALNSTALADAEASLTKVLELRVRACQNLIEASLLQIPAFEDKADQQLIASNIDWILNSYRDCEQKLLKVDKQKILIQLMASVLLVIKDKTIMHRLDLITEFTVNALKQDFQIDLADINNSDTILRLFLVFRSEQLPAYQKSAILENVVITKLLREIVFPCQEQLATLNNYNQCIVSCIRFLKKFSEGTAVIELLQDLIEDVCEIMGIARIRENLDDTFNLEQFGKREVILVGKRTKESEAEAVKALNQEYESYINAAGKSFLEKYLKANMPVEEVTRWRARKDLDSNFKNTSGPMRIKKRHAHKSAESLLRCREKQILSATEAKEAFEPDTTGPKDTVDEGKSSSHARKM